jgi:RHS repeat-associated protein
MAHRASIVGRVIAGTRLRRIPPGSERNYPGKGAGRRRLLSYGFVGILVLGSIGVVSVAATLSAGASDTWAVQYNGISITAISCPSTTSCFAVGDVDQGGAFTSMSGTSWSNPSVISSTEALTSLSCPSTTTCFAMGTSSTGNPIIEEGTNSGSSWAWTQIADPSAMNAENAISCYSATSCVLGGSIPGNYGATSILTISGGSPSWSTPVQLDFGVAVLGLSCPSSSFCGLTEGSRSVSFYYSSNGGTSWTQGSGELPYVGDGAYYVSLSCQSSGTCGAVGPCPSGVDGCGSGAIYAYGVTTNSGTSWSGGTGGGVVSSIACPSSSTCLAAGSQYIGYSNNNPFQELALSISTSTAESTSLSLPLLETEPGQPASAVGCASASECFIGGPFGLGETEGSKVVPVAFAVPAIESVSCGSAEDCLAVTTSGMAATNDGGQVWLNLPPIINNNCAPRGECFTPDAVSCFGATDCMIAGGVAGVYGSEAGYVTNNLGLTWTGGGSPGPTFGCGLSTSTCAAVSSSNTSNIYVTTSAGSSSPSWTELSSNFSDENAVTCGSATMCMVVGNSGEAELLVESGGSWSVNSVTTGTTNGLQAVSCPTASMCMAVGKVASGSTGTVLEASISGSSATITNLTGEANIPTSPLSSVACDSASSCSIFAAQAGGVAPTAAETSNGGSSFAPISAVPTAGFVAASCGATGFCVAAGWSGNGVTGYGSALVLATDGYQAPPFLPSALLPYESYGGPDGSRPCFSCALKAAGLSAQGFVSDPIDTADGDFYESIPIVSIPGLGPNLSFAVSYDSQLAQAELAANQTSPGTLGWGWSTNATMSLLGTGGSGTLTLDEEGGAQINYAPVAEAPGLDDATCTTSGTVQCFAADEGDVTAVLQETLGENPTYQFSRNGGLTTYNFNASGQLASISDANGHSETFAYDQTSGTICSASGVYCEIETDTEGRSLDIVFSASTNLITSVVDPAGRTWAFSYPSSCTSSALSNCELTGISNPRLGVESFAYDSGSANPTMVDNMTSLTEPNGQSGGPDAGDHLTIAYEESATSSTAPLGYAISETDPVGLETTYSYTGGNNPDLVDTTTVSQYLPGSGPLQSEVEYEYEAGVLFSEVSGVNTSHPETTTFVRNAQGLPTSVTDGNSHTTSYTYDANGNILTSTDASDNTWTYTYNAFNELLTSTPPSGSSQPETVNSYDGNGNLTQTVEDPSSPLTTTDNVCESATCSASGNSYTEGELESTTDPRGYSTTYTYDADGDLTSSTDPKGDDTTYAYISIGQLYCSTSPNATHAGVVCPTSPSTRVADTTSETFDSSDTLVASTTDPNGNTTHYTYDADGNQTVVEDPNDHYDVYGFDADDRTTLAVYGYYTSNQTYTTTAYDMAPGSTNCSSSVTNATYCTVVTQAAGSTYPAVTSYYYDAFNNLLQTTDPGGEVTANTYDQDNNLGTTTTGAGTTTYGYYPNNWLESEAFSNTQTGFTAPSSSTSFTYYNDGARKTMIDSTGTTTYGYDPYGRLQSVDDGAGKTVTYGYDADGDTTCMSYPNSGSATCQNSGAGTTGIAIYGYDTADRMTSLKDWNSETITFGYDMDSNWDSTTYPTTHATSVSETYGDADNLTGETVANVNLSGGSQSTTWTPDADELFNSTQANSGTADNYGYTTINQVSSLAGSDSYAYDELGRMTSDTPNGGTATNFGYNSDSALCWSGTGTSTSCSSPPATSTTYGSNAIDERCFSDTTGGVTGTCASPPDDKKATTYAYNQLGELTCDTASGTKGVTCANPSSTKTTTYTYNGDGLRMSDTPAGGSLQRFTWDVSGSVPLLLADGTDSYFYGPNGTPVEDMTTSGATDTYLVSDPTGVRYQFKAGGATDGTNSYNPYGQCISCTVKTAFGFEDGYTDPNGLMYLVNRYYDPSTDRFISVDPLVSATGQPFSYADDDPVNGSDPSGLWGWNPFADAEQVVHDQESFADTVRHDAAATGDWVATHPQVAVGIGLGVVAVATGGLGLAALAGYASVSAITVGAVSVAAGTGAALLDYPACFGHTGDQTTKTAACLGFGSGLIGAGLGTLPILAPESAFAVQFGTYGLAFGLVGNLADILNALRSSSLASAACLAKP